MDHPIERLPFVAPRKGRKLSSSEPRLPRDFWSVTPSRDYAQDCYTGKQMAREAIAYIHQNRDRNLLGMIVRDMIEKGDWNANGVVVGFMGEISQAIYGRAH